MPFRPHGWKIPTCENRGSSDLGFVGARKIAQRDVASGVRFV